MRADLDNAPLPFKILSILFLAAILCNCSAPRYEAITNTNFETIDHASPRLPYKRYVVVPDSLTQVRSYISERDLDGLKRFLNTSPYVEQEDLKLSWALYYFFAGDYYKSRNTLNDMQGDGYKCIKLLLAADCEYEIAYRKRLVVYADILPRYQQAMDCDGRQLWKQLFHMRAKYARYGQ